MKSVLFVGFLLLLLFLFVACTPIPEVVVGEEVESESQSGEQESEIMLNQEIKEVLDKSRGLYNYNYLADISRLSEGGVYIPEFYTIYRKGDLVRKTLSRTLLVNGQSYTDVILDLNDQTAEAICLVNGVTCEKRYGEKAFVEYEEFSDYITPHDLIEQIPGNAVIVRTSSVENRKSLILGYEEDGKRVELAVDTYTGLPIKKEVFSDINGEKPVETIIFKKFATNGVKDSDVVFK